MVSDWDDVGAAVDYIRALRHVDRVSLVNQTIVAQGLSSAQLLGTLFDGMSRHTEEGYAFQRRAAEVGFRQAVRERDEPFGDPGPSTFKG